ncbi:MAG: hypothetical protein ACI4F0_07520 [Agathobacter sp.]
MVKGEMKEFKALVKECLMLEYQMSEIQAHCAVRDSYFSTALRQSPELAMHDSVEEWARFIYNENLHEEPLQM